MNVPILKYVDVLIGLSLVMLLVSTVVLAVTQMALNSCFARARHLQKGLHRLILSLNPTELQAVAPYLSRLILRHPRLGQQTMFTPFRKVWWLVRQTIAGWRGQAAEPLPPLSPGSVIQREELAYLLIELAAGEGPLQDPLDNGTLPGLTAQAQTAVADALKANGIEDPAATLRAIRLKMVENERAAPNEPSHRWYANAVSDCAPTDFVAKIHAGFDGTMARVTDAFTAESKLWVGAVALVVAFALQLDAFALVKRLSIDESYRDTLVKIATEQVASGAIVEPDAVKPDAGDADLAKAKEAAKQSLALLASPSINLLPPAPPAPEANAGRLKRLEGYFPAWNKVPGVLFAWVLLSLGAPFWFDMLKNLLKLRSLLAKKDEAEREERQQTQTAAAPAQPAPVTASGSTVIGEAGDLAATGALG